MRTIPSVLVGATLVVSGDGRYYSKEAIQVIFYYLVSKYLIYRVCC